MAEQSQSVAIPQDQLMAQLRTRGFESGGFQSPLRRFRGRLTGITGAMVQRGKMTEARLEVTYNFNELDVIESTEPYPFPVAQISLLHSIRDKSGMGILGKSIDKIINAGIDENLPQSGARNHDFLIGKIQEWAITPGHMMWSKEDNKETPRDAWEVVFVEGVGGHASSGVASAAVVPVTPGRSPVQAATALLDGLTQQQWNNVVFQDPTVKSGGGELTSAIINGDFMKDIVEPLKVTGKVTIDANGVFHVKS